MCFGRLRTENRSGNVWIAGAGGESVNPIAVTYHSDEPPLWKFLNAWNFFYFLQPETFALVIGGNVFVPVSSCVGREVGIAIIRPNSPEEYGEE